MLFLPLYLENVERSLLLVQPGRMMLGREINGLMMDIKHSSLHCPLPILPRGRMMLGREINGLMMDIIREFSTS